MNYSSLIEIMNQNPNKELAFSFEPKREESERFMTVKKAMDANGILPV